jgi:endonuclease/exonuclease/phosphatase family metal-dependent hydrolase
MATRLALVLLAALGCGTACRAAVNYAAPDGPRYIGSVPPVRADLPQRGPDTVRVVTFNIKFALHVDRAAELLRSIPTLYPADIVALQEMDELGVRTLAAALGMSYVYYPATVHPRTGRDFGNAILSRWPIMGDRKIVLPHLGRFHRAGRAAVGATVLVGAIPVWVYSLHLGTQFEIGPGSKREQVRAVLRDAANYPRVIVAGDMNSHGIGREFVAHAYRWPTEHQPGTDHFFNWDHIFLLGLGDPPSSGVVRDNHKASDHRPVWAVVSLGASPAPASAPGP